MGGDDEVDDILRSAVARWRRTEGPPGAAGSYVKWSVPGGFTVGGRTLGAPAAAFVVWVAAAAGSGVLGGAAYDGLKLLISQVRERWRKATLRREPPPILRRDDVVFLTRLAMRVAQIEEGRTGAELVEVNEVRWIVEDGAGTWEVHAFDEHRECRLIVPDSRPEEILIKGYAD